MKWITKISVLFGVLFLPATSMAQIYGTNTVEYQLGNLPFEEPKDYSTVYNQLNLYYDSGNLSFFSRVEYFDSPVEERDFFDLSQKRIQYEDDQFRIRVGNFYHTIGRGLLLRTYDIPGSVFEDAFNRTRYGFYSDLEGIAVDYTSDIFEITVLRGSPLFNRESPNIEPDSLRRPDVVEALETKVYLSDRISVGGTFMRHNSAAAGYREYGALSTDFNPIDNIQVFGEYAFSTKSVAGFDDTDSFAFYSGVNFYYESLGGSFEYKNYNNFLLGGGGGTAFNDPPSLIKEHTYPVLNRSTYEGGLIDETGIQGELYYNFEGGHAVTVNYARANNDILDWQYNAIFLEAAYQATSTLTLKTFVDLAEDDFDGIENQVSLGLITENTFNNKWNVILDLQYQQFDRVVDPDKNNNYYSALSVGYLPDLVVSLILEATTDPQLTDDLTTFTVEETDTRFWLGGNASYQINRRHTLDIFAGKRRGGPACTSGICYDILDFEGVELRFSTRF